MARHKKINTFFSEPLFGRLGELYEYNTRDFLLIKIDILEKVP
jgi:hypothetical protein